jgi:prepilin-type processing-associated H-X9-DG protein
MRENHAKCVEITHMMTNLGRPAAQEALASVMLDTRCMKQARAQFSAAFTLIELIFILAAVFLPALTGQHGSRQQINCVNNLKQVGLAFRTWALDNNDNFPMRTAITNGGAMESVTTGNVFRVFQVMSNELSTPRILICPEENDPKRVSASIFETSVPLGAMNSVPFTNDNNVSYFVNINAQDTFPGMPLCGDHNIAVNGVPAPHGVLQVPPNSTVTWFGPRHNKSGNIALADGSVQGVASGRLGALINGAGIATNRLAIP